MSTAAILFVLTHTVLVAQTLSLLSLRHHVSAHPSWSLQMGLYDSPFPSPSEPSPNEDEKDTEGYLVGSPPRLFSLTQEGIEKDGLLPPLNRTSRTNLGPVYDAQDPKVLNIVRGLGVAWEDAAWALKRIKEI